MKEQQVQSKIIKQLECEGFYVVKLIKTNKSGIPDLIAIKENRCLFVEVKAKNGVLSPLQKFRIEELKNNNIECQVLYEGEGFVE